MTTGVFIDVSQLMSWPARTGVQRLLSQLLRHWPEHVLPAQVGFREDERFYRLPLRLAATQMEAFFADDTEGAATAFKSNVRAVADEYSAETDVLALADAYFLPEPTYEVATLRRAVAFRQSGRPIFALVMDTLPALEPWFFGGRHQRTTDSYFHFIAQLDNVGFISESAKNDVERRLRRAAVPNALVVAPGADGFIRNSAPLAQEEHFLVLGTIEPRKNTNLILDAAAMLEDNAQRVPLVVIGAAGGDGRAVSRLESAHDSVRWLRNATDQQVAKMIQTARGLIFVGEHEGFGLPPLEALHLGCPVVLAENLPSIQGLPAWGQIRLSTLTVESVADAIRALNRPSVNATMREALQHLSLPLWADFSHSLASWMAATMTDDA